MHWFGYYINNILITVEVHTLLIHNSEMTSLSEGVKRSEMICMLAVPAKMTCIELMKFVAPSEWVNWFYGQDVYHVSCRAIIKDPITHFTTAYAWFSLDVTGELYCLLWIEFIHIVANCLVLMWTENRATDDHKLIDSAVLCSNKFRV